MTAYRELTLGDLFHAVNGRAIFTKDYLDTHPGSYPVYSASLAKPFGRVNTFDYEGNYLTWVMNGYGGRMQEVVGKFSINRDRGLLLPKAGVHVPDLAYVRSAVEAELVANAVGRRVDGRLNEYTKIYPDTASAVSLQLPLTASGGYDYDRMTEIGARIRRIEAAQASVRAAREPLENATFTVDIPEPVKTVSLGNLSIFSLSIGKRVLQSQHSSTGIPVFSANALIPFGRISVSNLDNFSTASLLWGIDGNFDWNFIPAGKQFATTDHCGRLQVLEPSIDAEFVYWFLRATRARYGFDRVYRASLGNVRADVTIQVPFDPGTGSFSYSRQVSLAATLRTQEAARSTSIEALDNVLRARMAVAL